MEMTGEEDREEEAAAKEEGAPRRAPLLPAPPLAQVSAPRAAAIGGALALPSAAPAPDDDVLDLFT